VDIGGRAYQGDALAGLIGEKQVPVRVPLRVPDGAAMLFLDGVIHRLHPDTCRQTDPAGARRQGELAGLQRKEVKARRAAADLSVDVPGLLAAAADRDPMRVNPPTEWGPGRPGQDRQACRADVRARGGGRGRRPACRTL